MKLIQCHIENFGTLHDCSFEFHDGLNELCDGNGKGKSTLAAFLAAMFYGLCGARKRSLAENERKRYKPWQGGAFGGSLTFEAEGKRYVVNRTFGDKDGADEFELRDADTNMLSDDYGERLGEEIFGIDKDSFSKTVFIGQGACQTSPTDGINAKVGNLKDELGDMDRYEDADSRLAAVVNRLNPARATGSIRKRRDEIAQSERIVRDGNGITESIRIYEGRLKEALDRQDSIRADLEATRKIYDKAVKQQADRDKRRELERLGNQVDVRRLELKEIEGRVGGIVPETEDIKRAQALCADMERARAVVDANGFSPEEEERLQQLRLRFPDGAPNEDEIGTDGRHAGGRAAYVFVFAGALLAVLGLVAVALLHAAIFGCAVAIIGCVVVILGLGLHFGKKRGNLDELKGAAERLRMYEERCDRASRAQQQYGKCMDEMGRLLGRYGITPGEDLRGELSELLGISMDYSAAVRACDRAQAELKAYRDGLGPDFPEDVTDDGTEENLSPEELGDRLSGLVDELGMAGRVVEDYRKRLEDQQENLDNWEAEKARLANLKAVQEDEQREYDCAVKAREKLASARDVLMSRYSDPILEGFGRYYGLLTGKEASGFHVDAKTTVTLEEHGKQREAETQSAGLQDLLGICLRMSLVDAMYKGEKPVIIMDDPFTNLDDDKVVMGRHFMEEVAKEYQVVYFTCSRARSMDGTH
jgi:hypothetical protein